MKLFPNLQLIWLGGWILFLIDSIITVLSLLLVQKEIRMRLTDRSNYSRNQKIYLLISKLLGLVIIILIFFTPLANGLDLIIGLIIFIIGEIGLIIAILNFIQTPLDKPVTKGLYKISRHPQEVMIFILMIGIAVAIGSGIVLILLIISRIPFHLRILAEEDACLKKYGDSYKEYMEKVPRYFVLF